MVNDYFVCNDVMDIREDVMKFFLFFKYLCVFVRCENKQKKIKVICVVFKINSICWLGMIGENIGVKLVLWIFGFFVVVFNFFVLGILLCNSEVCCVFFCIFVMNLLLGNIFIGVYIVIVMVFDMVIYENLFECYKE